MCTCISETDKSGRCLDCGELQKPSVLERMETQVERLKKQLAVEKERADYAWKNTKTIDKARVEDQKNKMNVKKLVSVTKREQGGYNVTYYNGTDMGTFEYGIDGYLYYWPSKREGCWSAPPMREIANLLDHLNAPWDKQIQRDWEVLEK